MKIDIDQFREIFFAEASEHLETLESSLLKLDSTPDDSELLNAIFRSAHSMKGASGTFGFEDIARFTHVLENLLDKLREVKLRANPQLVSLLLRSCDVLSTLVEAAKSKQSAPAETEVVLDELRAVLSENPVEEPAKLKAVEVNQSEPSIYRIKFSPSADLFRQGLDPLLLLQDLAELGEITSKEVDDSKIPAISLMDPETCYLTWDIVLNTTRAEKQIKDVFCFVDESTKVEIKKIIIESSEPIEIPVETVTPRNPETIGNREAATTSVVERRGDRSSIRVSIDKIDKLVNLVEELVVTQSILNQFVETSGQSNNSGLEEIAATMDRNLRELQERVMYVRMVPISTVTGRNIIFIHKSPTFSVFHRVPISVSNTAVRLISQSMISEDFAIAERYGKAHGHRESSPRDRLPRWSHP
jgi:two-component system chemotaxis sensor kinase CheA